MVNFYYLLGLIFIIQVEVKKFDTQSHFYGNVKDVEHLKILRVRSGVVWTFYDRTHSIRLQLDVSLNGLFNVTHCLATWKKTKWRKSR